MCVLIYSTEDLLNLEGYSLFYLKNSAAASVFEDAPKNSIYSRLSEKYFKDNPKSGCENRQEMNQRLLESEKNIIISGSLTARWFDGFDGY